MKVKVSFIRSWSGYVAIMEIQHSFLQEHSFRSKEHKGKGELKRKVIQFCSDLNLEVEWFENAGI